MPEGKIMKALSGFYYVIDDHSIYQCRGRGKFRKDKITPLVGDYVVYQQENDHEGYILEIKSRKNELVRPPIANVDQAILVFSAKEPDFNTVLLDRFLVSIEAKNVHPIILITKYDLLSDEEKAELDQLLAHYKQIGYPVLLTSAKEQMGIDQFFGYLQDCTSVICGQSGVGKTTIINELSPHLNLKTGEISTHLGRGRHTTRHVELIPLGNGLIADTPGFSSLDFDDIEAGELNHCFPEISEKAQDCKFRGCLHVNEPKCAVKDALNHNEIPTFRYNHYVQFLEEIQNRKPRY
ncbi:ribosome small subunit-dependent GTPase A [Heyndrickxia ginsengihumi]|uniref:Small ribosomal subunit biogenesis GTPase RsgA n=1 Tax=Heyndrickxia ginsengihumi TaxID=363870 RepID=A0A0A6VF26_9BACI|nr:ribosome small subunit-dependent GTPase A [Heyndrickxia ginsengihumi]KHD86181.1 GTPase RsgA [Heyndrickxia ginsengihumi]MBE6184414.1 ribosome small subunit-dependent GTPase A [Bacillus sp. (in: firmicutes)]MCM3022447.1 ribosome small subunit-dependent GTPase A [Heyndrickxia ginsengihumi]NEY19567.1 ribosome small subunit-dependent GTPase A [Heyndrickxia ginsengihumi]